MGIAWELIHTKSLRFLNSPNAQCYQAVFSGTSGLPSLCGEDPCQVLECVSGTDCLAFLPAMDGSRCNNQGSVCYQGECLQSKYQGVFISSANQNTRSSATWKKLIYTKAKFSHIL